VHRNSLRRQHICSLLLRERDEPPHPSPDEFRMPLAADDVRTRQKNGAYYQENFHIFTLYRVK
jgi:hypothetical protein